MRSLIPHHTLTIRGHGGEVKVALKKILPLKKSSDESGTFSEAVQGWRFFLHAPDRSEAEGHLDFPGVASYFQGGFAWINKQSFLGLKDSDFLPHL